MSLQLLTILTAAGGMALVAITHNAAAVFFMFSSLVAVVLVSYATSWLSARALAWRRASADRVFEDDPLTIEVELTNRGRLPRFSLTVRDTLPPFLESDELPEFVLPALWPGERARLSYQARARKRGVYPLGPLSIWVSDPFGVFQRYAPLDARAESIVYPRPVLLDGDPGGTILRGGGPATGERARAYEAGLDFYGIRDYQPGDELRRIHWPATAHHGRLTVIEFDRGAAENLAVILDTRAGSEFGSGLETTLEVGVRIAASLIHWTLARDGAAFLAVDSSDGPRWLGVDRLDHEHEALELLARVKAEGTMPVSAVLEWAGLRLPSGATVCVVTAAPDDELPALVETLGRRHLQLAVILLDAPTFDSSAPGRAARPTVGAAAAISGALSAAGAVTAAVRRGDDLRSVLQGVLFAGE